MTEDCRVQRTTLLVADLDRSLALYRGVLGFAVEYIIDSKPDSYSYPTFGLAPGVARRFATLNSARQPRVLGLIEVAGLARPPPGAPRAAALVIEAPHLERLAARLAQLADVNVQAAGALITSDGRRGIEQALWDADGHVIVLYRITA